MPPDQRSMRYFVILHSAAPAFPYVERPHSSGSESDWALLRGRPRDEQVCALARCMES